MHASQTDSASRPARALPPACFAVATLSSTTAVAHQLGRRKQSMAEPADQHSCIVAYPAANSTLLVADAAELEEESGLRRRPRKLVARGTALCWAALGSREIALFGSASGAPPRLARTTY
jgi:hypothetical protein